MGVEADEGKSLQTRRLTLDPNAQRKSGSSPSTPKARCPEPPWGGSGSVELRLAFDEFEQVSVDQLGVGRKQAV